MSENQNERSPYEPENVEPQDAGDAANDLRFSEEEQLIREQAQGVRPDKQDVPSGVPGLDEAAAGMDVPDAELRGGDASDDPAHHGKET
ncbi:hypothetical protein [Sinomonas mesophila]|uniref:hypothetical protein n=1 Tax=Sinomonas mesophila TaxID=1531955 RepID=UPI0009878DCC|nr:hypothetical protein [Sinomonas mesophila]